MLQILYHNDFDGLASAAVLSALVRDKVDEREFRFIPVDYHMTDEWTQARPPAAGAPGAFAVVDFLYHPNALFWYDHHATTFRSEEARQHMLARADAPGVKFDPQAKSCTSLILDQWRESWPGATAYADLATMADEMDQAQFASPEAFFEQTTPALQIDQGRRLATPGRMEEVVRRLAVPDVAGAAALVAEEAGRAKQQNARALAAYAEHQTRAGPVVVTDVVGKELPFLRFAAFVRYPTASYSVTLYSGLNGTVRVGLNKNAWLSIAHWHLGQLASRVGGGGHSYAAGADFSPSLYGNPYAAAVEWVRQQVVPVLQQAPPKS